VAAAQQRFPCSNKRRPRCKVSPRGVQDHRRETQAFAIYQRVLEIDQLLASGSLPQTQFREVHPEVCFWALNADVPVIPGKKTPEGRAIRKRLLTDCLGGEGPLSDIEGLARKGYGARRTVLGDDDILDALAALWTAERVSRGRRRRFPRTRPETR
jgi:predicted RNase H-like nuclease